MCPVVDVASPVEGKPQDSDDDSDLYTEEDKLGEEQAYNEPLSIGAGCASSQLLPLLCCAVHEGRSAQRGSSFPKVAFVGEYWRSSARSLLRRNLEECVATRALALVFLSVLCRYSTRRVLSRRISQLWLNI